MQVLEKKRATNRGFTLIETIMVLLLMAILLGISGSLCVISLRAWDSGYIRTGIREDISCAMDKTVRDLKEAANASLGQYSSIAHTIQYDDLSGKTYVLYLYNAADATLDSTYSESAYRLHKADIDAGDTPASGGGVLVLSDLVSPDATAPTTALSIDPNGTEVTLDFVVQRVDETVRTRTKVRPRNL